jgi:hypothetical protein
LRFLGSKLKIIRDLNAQLDQELQKRDSIVPIITQNDIDSNAVLKQLLAKYLSDKNTKEFFTKLNKKGLYNGFFDVPKDIKTLLFSVFFAAATGNVLPPVVKNAQIFAAMDKINKNLGI